MLKIVALIYPIAMFTGIIEVVGNLTETQREGRNAHLKICSTISNELKIDQSVSHNGACLTVTKVEDGCHWATAIEETLKRSNLGMLPENAQVNLERCMAMNGRLEGHIVQGHVDTTAEVTGIEDRDGSWLFDFELKEAPEPMVEKGSVAINGISLTCFGVKGTKFSAGIIPYTYDRTNFNRLGVGSVVNIEFDLVGKYIRKITGPAT